MMDENQYENTQIGNADFKAGDPMHTKKARKDVSRFVKKGNLKKFRFPSLGITIEAESLAEATAKLESYKKK
jgi:hypothetical protein